MPAPNRREEFDLKLAGLETEVEGLAYYVGETVQRSVEALKVRDLAVSRQVIVDDDYIDQKQAEIESRCIDLIATQQPVARDLRSIIALLHIGVELERMGDYAEGIGKISLRMGDEPPLKPLIDIPLMAQKATDMLHDSIDALLSRDTEKAKAVCDADDEVDDLLRPGVPRPAGIHDRGPRYHPAGHLPSVGGARPGGASPTGPPTSPSRWNSW